MASLIAFVAFSSLKTSFLLPFVVIVIYAVLRDIIGIISDTFIRDSYVDEKGYLHFTENVSNYRKKIADEAFSLMGEPYNEWNRQGISIWDFNRSFAGE